MDQYEYMGISRKLIPDTFMDEYDLHDKAQDGYLYMEICQGLYRLPQARRIANDLLCKCLSHHSYHEAKYTPGMWKHTKSSNMFTLVVDECGSIEIDISGSKYCGVTLDWNYNTQTLDVSMPCYITTQCKKFYHPDPQRPQHCPYPPPPQQYGTAAQALPPANTSPKISAKQIKKYNK
eukprot:11612654-Ditylum_brightwellii.AAC.1